MSYGGGPIMENKFIYLIILFASVFFLNGCDSPSGSKPDAVTKPTLVSPTDNATNVSVTPTFQWSGEANKLEISLNPNFSTLVHSTNVTGQTYTAPAGVLLKNTRYYWHAGKTSGSDIYWSDDKFSFVTVTN